MEWTIDSMLDGGSAKGTWAGSVAISLAALSEGRKSVKVHAIEKATAAPSSTVLALRPALIVWLSLRFTAGFAGSIS